MGPTAPDDRSRTAAARRDASHAAQRARASWMGLGALVLWSATIPLTRILSERLGTTTAASGMLLLGGALGLAYHAVRGTLGSQWRLPKRYLFGCGGLFVGYMACLYLAIGLAESRQQVVEVGILNYLWPTLTLLLAVALGRRRVRPFFWPAVLLALVGAALAPLRPREHSFEQLAVGLATNPWPYPLALAAALCWALYSVLSRRWAAEAGHGGVPLFTLASGILLGALRLARPEASHPTVGSLALLVLMAVFPVLVAYGLWDYAVRRGNLTLLAAASYGAPIASTLLSWWLLDVSIGWSLWLSCALVSVGALGAERAVSSRDVRSVSAR